MTRVQYNNWKDFTVRMAKTVYPHATKKRRDTMLQHITYLFDELECNDEWSWIKDWDGNGDNCFLEESLEEFYRDILHWNDKKQCYTGKFYNQIVCCVQAGFDMAVKQSGGALDFTVGDVRKMYDGQVPEWVTPDNFNNEPDDTQVWL